LLVGAEDIFSCGGSRVPLGNAVKFGDAAQQAYVQVILIPQMRRETATLDFVVRIRKGVAYVADQLSQVVIFPRPPLFFLLEPLGGAKDTLPGVF
jgi:hypothetical protein